MQDKRDKLNAATYSQVPQLAEVAAKFAGHIVLRLVHDHLLRMDVTKYDKIIRFQVAQINTKVNAIKMVSVQLLFCWMGLNLNFSQTWLSCLADVDGILMNQ